VYVDPKMGLVIGRWLVAPLAPKLSHDAAHAYARRLARQLAATDPESYVTSAVLAKRPARPSESPNATHKPIYRAKRLAHGTFFVCGGLVSGRCGEQS
jgi:hypothetical protein